MKIIVVSPKNRTAYNFRGDLIRELVARGNEVLVTGPNRIGVEKILELGARFAEIPNSKNSLNPFEDLQYFFRLYKLFRRERPDRVFAYTSKPVIYGSVAARLAKISHIAAMVTGAGYAFTSGTRKAKAVKCILSVLYKLAFRCADVVIFQNQDDQGQFVAEKLVVEEKCRLVNGSGVNLEAFTPAPLPEQTTFFMLSRVMYSKGIREYLQACETVKAQYPAVRCMLLGACEGIQDSMTEEDLLPYIERGIIEYFGETEQVASYYRQCSVYVLPSYREGTPRTVLEAMAMGRPVITTDAPGCRETVIDGETGYLVPVKDGNAVARRMICFLEEPQRIAEMGRKSLEYCRSKFDVHKVNERMLQHLRIQ